MTAVKTPGRHHSDPAHRQALEAYLEQLRSLRAEQPASADGGLVVGGQFALDAWDVQQLDQAFAQPASAARTGAAVVADALALLLKSTADEERLRDCGDRALHEFYGLEAEVMLDVALGGALVRELQRTIEQVVLAGEMKLARNQTRVLHRLRNAVDTLQRGLVQRGVRSPTPQGAGEPEAAEPQAPAAISAEPLAMPRPVRARRIVPRHTPAPSCAAVAPPANRAIPDRPRRPQARERHREARSRTAGRTLFARALLVLTLGLYLAIVVAPRYLGSEPLATFPAERVVDGEVFQALLDRRPSLFATVDATAWKALDAARRAERMEGLAAELQTRGYFGALVHTEEGQPVARWSRQRGVVWLEGEPPAQQPQPAPSRRLLGT